VAAFLVLFGVFFAYFIVPTAIEDMEQNKGVYLREAIGHAFLHYLMVASFIPVIGPFIGKMFESKKNPLGKKEE
jgi:hypothetical protein